jgi:hippurate hydrolase
MCGHDIHMASILGGASKIMDNLDKIPSDKTVRLLFQPAEERHGGALPMIQEGCLEGVDEVYGFHNWPGDPPGKIIAKEGPFMAASTRIIMTVKNP